ncbi:MAG: hypothetical protein RLZZ522_89 [Verrucomicrobiota bacterium]
MTLFPRSAILFMLGLASLRADNRGSANYTIVTGAVVYQDSAATAAAAYGGFNATLPLIILNTASDNFGAYADAGTQRTVTDLAATGPRKFYRVVIVRP